MPKQFYDPSLAEIARKLGVSRQFVWQMLKKAEGKCILCGNPREQYAAHCDYHAMQHLIHERKRIGTKKPYGPRGPNKKRA